MKKIVIVGASSGIGRAVAESFASMGWKVGVAARREDRLKELQQKYPDHIVWETIDITASDATGRLLSLIEKTGGMDTFLQASGVGFLDEIEESNLVKVLQTNVVGFAKMTAAAYRYYRDQTSGVGQIAAITSVAGTKGIGSLPAYSAAKKFDNTFLDALDQLSHENKFHIDFTDIRPGFIKTDLLVEDHTYPMLMKLEDVVPKIVKAIVRKRRVVYIDWRYGLLAKAWALTPRAIWTRMSSKKFS